MSARAERGAALLEATVAVALTAMVTAAAFQAFSAAGRGGADAALRLRALAQAETVLDSHLHPALLTAAAREALTREGAAGDIGICWRVEGTQGLAEGTIGWPSYPEHTPSTLRYTTVSGGDTWAEPSWSEAWFPDAFVGPMAQLLVALERGEEPEIDGRDNLDTMALVEACYRGAVERAVIGMDDIRASAGVSRSRDEG